MMFDVFISPTSNTQPSPSAEPAMAPQRACRSPASSSLIVPQHAAVIEQRKNDGHSCPLSFDVSPSPRPLYGVDYPRALITDEVVKKEKFGVGCFSGSSHLSSGQPQSAPRGPGRGAVVPV